MTVGDSELSDRHVPLGRNEAARGTRGGRNEAKKGRGTSGARGSLEASGLNLS